MSTDAGQQDRPRSPWRLPKVICIEITHARYAKAKQYFFAQRLRGVKTAVEIVVHTDEEMPGGGSAPVLFVGEYRLTESEPAGLRKTKFLAFEASKLKEHAPIVLGWDFDLKPRAEADFYYSAGGKQEEGSGTGGGSVKRAQGEQRPKRIKGRPDEGNPT